MKKENKRVIRYEKIYTFKNGKKKIVWVNVWSWYGDFRKGKIQFYGGSLSFSGDEHDAKILKEAYKKIGYEILEVEQESLRRH